MTKRFKTAFASLAVATLCTLGSASQASAFDLLEELLGGGMYADSCGCSQKGGGHVQRCGANCGGKGVSGHAQRSGGKGGHVQNGGKAGHVQRGGCGGGKGHVQSSGCGGGKGHVQSGGKGHVQRGACSGGKGGHVQRAAVSKGGGKGGKGGKSVDLFAFMQSHVDSVKCKLSSYRGGKGKGGKGDSKVDVIDGKSGFYGDSGSIVVPAPVITEEIQSVPVPGDPDPST